MNWALREVLGEHVQQKGSLVDPDKTRFDFSNPKALTAEQIERVEQLVNDKIQQKLPVYDEPVPQKEALKINGLRAVFGEKYPDVVRVLSVGTPVSELVANPDNPAWRDTSIEFCGGTHVKNTADIGCFAIVSEEAVAKGIRRVVGVTGEAAKQATDLGAELLQQALRLQTGATDVAAGPRTGRDVAAGASPAEDLASQVAKLQQDAAEAAIRVADRTKLRDAIAELQKIIKQQHKQQAAAAQDVVADKVAELLHDAPKIGDTTVFVFEMPDVPVDQLKTGADIVKQKCGSAAILFGVHAGATERRSDEATQGARNQAVPQASAPGQTEPQASAPGQPERDAQASAKAVPDASAPGQGKALLLAAMTPDLIKKGLKAGDLVKHVAPIVKGGGGGPPTMAQAGGKDPSKIGEALDAGRSWIEEKLK